jgi:uncharacterized membrane protein
MRILSKLGRSLRARRDEERGAVLVFTAMCMVLLLWAGAMGVDVGFSVWGSRQAQAMADTAALDLARSINFADANTQLSDVQKYLNGKLANVETDNASNARLSVIPGIWNGTSFAAPSYGCLWIHPRPTNEPPCNAVQVTAAQSVPQVFYGGFRTLMGHGLGANGSTVAADTPESTFSIGTYLASYTSQDMMALNVILGALGTSANITLVGYQGLANTFVTVNQLITASGGLLTPSNVMTTSLPGNEWSIIWQDAVANQVAQLNCAATPTPGPCNAASALSSLGSWSTSASLCQMVSINGSSCTNGDLSAAAETTSLNVLQMLTTEAEAANGTNALGLTGALNLTVPGLGISNVQLFLTQGQVPQVAIGTTGATASTSQVTADVQMTLSIAGVSLGVLDVPLSAASGTATLNTLSCQSPTLGPSVARINVTTTASSAAVTLAGLSLGSMAINGVTGGSATFTTSVVPPTATTAQGNSNPVKVGTTSPTFTAGGTINPLVSTLLSSVLPSALAPVLQAAGVSIGNAEVADLNINCGAVSIVQ